MDQLLIKVELELESGPKTTGANPVTDGPFVMPAKPFPAPCAKTHHIR